MFTMLIVECSKYKAIDFNEMSVFLRIFPPNVCLQDISSSKSTLVLKSKHLNQLSGRGFGSSCTSNIYCTFSVSILKITTIKNYLKIGKKAIRFTVNAFFYFC